MKHFEMMRLLMPSSRVLNIVNGTVLKKTLKSLSVLPRNIRLAADLLFLDLFPDTTRGLAEWEEQFGLSTTGLSVADRRKVLAAAWRSTTGGQSVSYLQNVVSAMDANIKIVENVPVTNPRDSYMRIFAVCGNQSMCCGNEAACCGYRRGDDIFVPRVLINDTESVYSIPANSLYWEPCFFVCGGVELNESGQIMLVNKIQVASKWKGYLEYLILKFKPVHTKAVVFVEYV